MYCVGGTVPEALDHPEVADQRDVVDSRRLSFGGSNDLSSYFVFSTSLTSGCSLSKSGLDALSTDLLSVPSVHWLE